MHKFQLSRALTATAIVCVMSACGTTHRVDNIAGAGGSGGTGGGGAGGSGAIAGTGSVAGGGGTGGDYPYGYDAGTGAEPYPCPEPSEVFKGSSAAAQWINYNALLQIRLVPIPGQATVYLLSAKAEDGLTTEIDTSSSPTSVLLRADGVAWPAMAHATISYACTGQGRYLSYDYSVALVTSTPSDHGEITVIGPDFDADGGVEGDAGGNDAGN